MVINRQGRVTLPKSIRLTMGLTSAGYVIVETAGVSTVLTGLREGELRRRQMAQVLDMLRQDIAANPGSLQPLRSKLWFARHCAAAADAPPIPLHAHPILLRQAQTIAGASDGKVQTFPGRGGDVQTELQMTMLVRVPLDPFRAGRRFAHSADGNDWLSLPLQEGRLELFYMMHGRDGGIVYGWLADTAGARPLPLAEPHVLYDDMCFVSATGQTVLPRSVRRRLGVEMGGRLSFRRDGERVLLAAEAPRLHFVTMPLPHASAEPLAASA